MDSRKDKNKNLLKEYSNIIFDCDGVIFNSNKKKSDIFQDVLMLKGYPQNIVDSFVDFHKVNGGISRYEKFKIFITKFLENDFDIDLYNSLLCNYSNECIKMYEKADLTSGLVRLLKEFSGDCYVASGSDEDELNIVFRKRRIDGYFKKIYGSPKTKNQCVSIILSELEIRGNVVLIGDSKSDLSAANASGIDFIYMSKYSENHEELIALSKEFNFRVIDTLNELL